MNLRRFAITYDSDYESDITANSDNPITFTSYRYNTG